MLPLFKYTIDNDIEQTRLKAQARHAICPPLRPDRFRRRIKMLWGVDVNDYPNDSKIWFTNWIVISKRFQTIEDLFEVPEDHPLLLWDIPDTILQYFRQHLFFGDAASFRQLKEYRQLIEGRLNDESYNPWNASGDVTSFDLLYRGYRSTPFQANCELVRYIDEQVFYELFVWHFTDADPPTTSRISDVRCDHLSRYIALEQEKGRIINPQPVPRQPGAIGLGLNFTDPTFRRGHNNPVSVLRMLATFRMLNIPHVHNPWPGFIAERGMCCFLSFLLQLQLKYANKFVILFMSGQLRTSESLGETHENIRLNNYYGYTILREFWENPFRETPILEKIGTSFRANVKEPNTLLLLEPFADSYDIDTIQPTEFLNAIEMGHDDYWFIEVEKPVESPVAGADGYAMIVDRTETVYGYIPKNQVKELTDADILEWETTRDKSRSKRGVINDVDGFTNIRSGQSTASEIIGRAVTGEVFHYWELPGNWWVVETEAGVRGFMFHNRIKEKVEAGGWIID